MKKKDEKREAHVHEYTMSRNIVQTGKIFFKAPTAVTKYIVPGIMFLPNQTQIIYFHFGDICNETDRSLSSTILLLIRP